MVLRRLSGTLLLRGMASAEAALQQFSSRAPQIACILSLQEAKADTIRLQWRRVARSVLTRVVLWTSEIRLLAIRAETPLDFCEAGARRYLRNP